MSVPWKPTNAMREVELRTDYIERMMAEGRPIDNGTLAHLMQAVEDYKARVAELEAIVGKLPRTADGVPVVPGQTYWAICHDWDELDPPVIRPCRFVGHAKPHVDYLWEIEGGAWESCAVPGVYSTKALAEAARQSATAGEGDARDE